MIVELCDVCKTNNASTKFKIKRSIKERLHDSWQYWWTPYEKIAICTNCAKKLLEINED